MAGVLAAALTAKAQARGTLGGVSPLATLTAITPFSYSVMPPVLS